MERCDQTLLASFIGTPYVRSKPAPSIGEVDMGRPDDVETPLIVDDGDDGRGLTGRLDSRNGDSGHGRSPLPYKPSPIQWPQLAPVSGGLLGPIWEESSHPAGGTKTSGIIGKADQGCSPARSRSVSAEVIANETA